MWRPPPGGRAGVAVQSGSGGVEPDRFREKSVAFGVVVGSTRYTICCLIADTSVERERDSVLVFLANFARSSTLAFVGPFYRNGLISVSDVLRSL